MLNQADDENAPEERQRVLVVTAAGLVAIQAAVRYVCLGRLWPKDDRTRGPSLWQALYSRMRPKEFRKRFRIPRGLFDIMLHELTAPSAQYPEGALSWG